MRDEIPPVTADSVRRAQAAAQAERDRDGIVLGPDGKVVLKPMVSVRRPAEITVLPLRPRVTQAEIDRICQLSEMVDAIIESGFTTDQVRDALDAIDAANGVVR